MKKKRKAALRAPKQTAPATFFVRRSTKTKSPTRDIHLKDFDVSVAGETLIKDASITLTYGRHYGLVGRNGAGKTTFLRRISSGELSIPPDVQVLHVEQEVIGDDTTALNSVLQSDLERDTLVREEKRLSTLTTPTREEEDKLLKIHKRLVEIQADSAIPRAASILSGLGFDTEMQNRATREFSGGWRMRISLARALFCQPHLLLLDEPTNMLDVKAVIWLGDYLKRWDRTVVVVSHDRDFLCEVATDIIHLSQQNFDVYKGNYEEFEKLRKSKLQNQQRAFESQQQHIKHVQKFIEKFRFNAKRASMVQSRIKMLKKMDVVAAVVEDPTATFNFPEPEKIR